MEEGKGGGREEGEEGGRRGGGEEGEVISIALAVLSVFCFVFFVIF